MQTPYTKPAVDELLSDMRSDVRSGASEIAGKGASALLAFSRQSPHPAVPYAEDLIRLCQAIIDTQPTLAPVFNLVNGVLQETQAARATGSAETIRRALIQAVKAYQVTTQRALDTIARFGQGLLHSPCTVLTHSSSKTVIGVLREASRSGKTIRAMVTESRPFCEGRELARHLGQEGIQTEVILDAAIAHYVKDVDMVIVGADRVAEESFVNKVGTLALAMVAKEAEVPFYIACESNKLLPAAVQPIGEVLEISEQRTREEWMNVELVYSLFEEIPTHWITGVITEEGLMSTNALAACFRRYHVSPELRKCVLEPA